MKFLTRYCLLLVLAASFPLLADAQGFRVESNSPPAPAGSETFTSMEGRFSISLPRQISGYTPRSADTPEGRVEGSFFSWKTAQGFFMVGYIERPEMLEEASKKVLDYLSQNAISIAKAKAKVLSETDISLEGHPGRELRLEFEDGFAIARMYIVRNRVYQANASLPKDKKAQLPTVIKILDSFKLLSQANVEAEIQKRIAEATPKPLPQEPVTKKLKSDADDEGLKGKVKTVFSEDENLDGTWAVSKRQPSSIEHYNEQGNLTKRVSSDYRGNPSDIEVYGYLDGDRVSHSESIEYEYNPPPMAMPVAPGQPKPKYDPRYSLKYKYKYDEKGNLIEEVLSGSNGEVVSRIVYSIKGKQKEKLHYSKDGSLNRKYSYLLDDKGIELEQIGYETKDNSIAFKRSYAYEFDSKGNWIKRTTSKLVTKDGKSQYEPYSVTYRTISYY